jgi:hypothetical protein
MFSFFRNRDTRESITPEPESRDNETDTITTCDRDNPEEDIVEVLDSFTVQYGTSLYIYDVDIEYLYSYFEQYGGHIKLPENYCHIDNIDRLFIPVIRNRFRSFTPSIRETMCHLIGYMLGLNSRMSVFHTVCSMQRTEKTRYFMEWSRNPRCLRAVIVVEYVTDILNRFIDDYLSVYDDPTVLPLIQELTNVSNPNGYMLYVVCSDTHNHETLLNTTEQYLRRQMNSYPDTKSIELGPRLLIVNDVNETAFDLYKKKGYTFDANLYRCIQSCFFKVFR